MPCKLQLQVYGLNTTRSASKQDQTNREKDVRRVVEHLNTRWGSKKASRSSMVETRPNLGEGPGVTGAFSFAQCDPLP